MNYYLKEQMFFLILLLIFLPINSYAEEKNEAVEKPDYVLSLTKENTVKNMSDDEQTIEPSEFTKELLTNASEDIKNPKLIKLLNETSVKPTPFSFGYRGMVYLGRWVLHYESEETAANWEYQRINKNELNNIGGKTEEIIQYVQQEEKTVTGALTSKVEQSTDVRSMLLTAAKEQTDLPLSFETTIGKNTKKDGDYKVPIEQQGYLQAYVPAIYESGHITLGEVYIELKGTQKSLVIKNVTKQPIGGWIPVEDHIALHFHLK